MQTIEFNKIKSISNFFVKYIGKDDFLLSRFPNNARLDDAEYLSSKAKSFANRSRAKSIIESSMSALKLSRNQLNNLSQIENSNTLFVITGQQAGLLGGPLYTSIKIASAISTAKKLRRKHPEINFIPLFWMEDNDHDVREAADVYYFDSNYDTTKISAFSDELLNIPVSDITFDDSIEQTIIDVIDNLPYSEWKTEIAEFLEDTYKPGTLWNDATISFHNKLFADEGILFAKASECRLSGALIEMLEVNLESQEKALELLDLLESKKSLLSEKGFDIAIKPDILNYCCHTQGKRYVVKQSKDNAEKFTIADDEYTFDDLKEFMLAQPEMFSPKALLRPVFQDKIFPNAISVLGAGEIAYHSLLKEAFEFFGDEVPAIEQRTSITFLLPKHREFLEAKNLTIEYFMRDNNEFEAELSNLITDDISEAKFEESKAKIAEAFASLNEILVEAEPSLERTSDSFSHKSVDYLDSLQKKYISAKKKKNFDIIQKYRKLKNFIYPNGKLQERSFSAVNFINFYGIKKFTQILLNNADKNNEEHIIY